MTTSVQLASNQLALALLADLTTESRPQLLTRDEVLRVVADEFLPNHHRTILQDYARWLVESETYVSATQGH